MDDQQVNCMFNAMAKCQSDHLVRHNDVPAEDRARSFLLTQNYASENPQGFQACDASCIDEGKSLISKPQPDCQSFAFDTITSLVEPTVTFVKEHKSGDILFMLQRIYEDVIDPLYFVASAGGLDECIKLSEFATSLLDILRRHNVLGPESDPRQELNLLLNKGRETVLKDEIQPETVVTEQVNENDVWGDLAVNQVPDDISMQWKEEEPVREITSESVPVLPFTEHFNKHGGSIATHSPPLVTNFSNSDVGSVVADMETEFSVFPSSNPTFSSLLILDNQHLSCSTENKIPLTVEELASTVSDDDDVGNPKRARRGKGQKRVGRRLKEQIN